MDAQSLSSQTIRGAIWVYVSKYSGKLLVFVTTFILARLLLEEDFGVAGYALVVMSFLEVLRGLGIGSALIYFPKTDSRTNSAFWVALVAGIALFIIAWFIAPFAGIYFNDPRAVPVVRAMGLTFPIGAFGVVHDALLQKSLAFRRRFMPDMARSFGKGLVSVILAFLGFGAWSLVWGQVAGTAAAVVALWIVVKWRPQFRFDFSIARELARYGSKIVSVNSLAVLLNNVDYLLIGRFLGAAALGVYTLAFRVPELTIKQLYVLVSQVLFPVYAKVKDDTELLRQGFLTTLRYISLITFPIGIGLALVSEPFVQLFLGERWAEAIPVIPPIAMYMVLRSLGFSAGDVYKAQGRPELLTRIKLAQAVVGVPALWWVTVTTESLVAIGWTQVAISIGSTLLSLIVARPMLNTSWASILGALAPAAFMGAAMGIAVWAVNGMTGDLVPLLQLIVAILAGAGVYLGGIWLFQRQLILDARASLKAAVGR